jgi:hypothetical protein
MVATFRAGALEHNAGVVARQGFCASVRPIVWLVLSAAAASRSALNGSEILPTNKPRLDGTLVKALAWAWGWLRMLDDGIHASVGEIGDAENISKSYVSRILRLALLAPDIVDAILAGSTDQAPVLERLERPLPADWSEQRGLLREDHGGTGAGICSRVRIS